MSFGEQLGRRLTPWNTPSLEILVGAFNAMAEPLASVLEGEGDAPAWGAILNPNTFPNTEGSKQYPYRFNPQFLAQFVGVTLLTQFSHAEAIAYIRAEPGFQRGSRTAIVAAITRVIGSTPYYLLERTAANAEADAYHFVVVVPKIARWERGTVAELEAALEVVKPGGVLFTIDEVEVAWIEGEKEWSEVGSGVEWSGVKEGEY